MKESSDKDTTLSKNPIVRYFFRMKFEIIISFANLRENDIILDFGCGDKWLKKRLPRFNIIGYDINPKQTEIRDYRTIKPTKIFCLDVFEHIPAKEIEKIIENFKKMNNNFELIVSIPTGNFISRKARKFVGKSEILEGHITSYKEILDLLKKNFELRNKINFFTVTKIFKFKNI